MRQARLTAVVVCDGTGPEKTVASLLADWPDWRHLAVDRQGRDTAPLLDEAWRRVADASDAVVFLAAGDELLPGYAGRLTPLFVDGVGAAYPDHFAGTRRVYAEPCGPARLDHAWGPRAALISADALRAVDGFDLRCGPAAVYDFWLRLTERFAAFHLPEPLARLAPEPDPSLEVWKAGVVRAQERSLG